MNRPQRILLVDDDQDILTVTTMALEVVGGYVTKSCAGAQEALACVEEFQPDLILVDVMMPELDGPSFVRRLQANPKLGPVPILFMTARTQAEDIASYLELGVIGVVSKPFDPEELVCRLDALSRTMQQFQQAYGRGLVEKMRQMEALRLNLGTEGIAQKSLEGLYRIAHNLAGSAASYGFEAVGVRARALETFLHPWMETLGSPGSQGTLAQLCNDLAAEVKNYSERSA